MSDPSATPDPVGTALDFDRLRVDGRAESLGIDSANPVFSWVVTGDLQGAEPVDAVVAVSLGSETLWRSPRVALGVGVLPRVRYDGPDLAALTRYDWSIQVTVRSDSGEVRALSAQAEFITGVGDDAAWAASRWIGRQEATPLAPDESARARAASRDLAAPLLERRFALAEVPTEALLVTAAGGYARATLNGRPVSSDVLSPGFTDYDRRVQYTVTDVSALLREGENLLRFELGRGFFGLTNPNVWSWQAAPWHAEPCVRALLRFSGGATAAPDVATDADWRVAPGPTLLDDLYGGEIHDRRLAEPRQWSDACLVAGPRGVLVAQTQQPIRVTETMHPVTISNPAPGVFVAHFARVIAGWVRLRARGLAGDTVELRYGEQLRADGLPNSDDEKHYFDDGFQHDVVTLAGPAGAGADGVETWESSFSYKGFQHVEITGWPSAAGPSTADLVACAVHSDVAEISTFNASDPLLDRLHRITVDTMLNNLHGIPTDTPKYEKNGWTGDAMVGADMFLTNLDSALLFEKWVQDVADTRPAGGPPALIAPNAGIFGVDEQAPVWHAAFVLVAWDIFGHTGDPAVLARHRDEFADYLRFELSRSPGGIADTILGDWCSPETDPGGGNPSEDARVTATALLARMLDLMGRIDRVLGRRADAEEWDDALAAVRRAFADAFVDTDGGVVRGVGDDGFRQTHALLALAFDLVPDAEVAARVAAGLAHDVARRGYHLDTGAVGTKHLLPILTRFGHVDAAWRVATQTEFPGWGFWLEQGATSLWEHWKPESRSRGHYFLGTVDDWLTGSVAGLRPVTPGWSEFEVAPAFTDRLESADASVLTPFGRAAVAWRRGPAAVEIDVTVPLGATALVTLPGRDADEAVRLGAGFHRLSSSSSSS